MRARSSRDLTALALSAVTLPLLTLLPVGAASAAPSREVAYTQWDTGKQLRSGARKGAGVRAGKVVLGKDPGQRRYRGTTYDVGTWTSPWTSPGFGLTELIASWDASTPGRSWVEVRVRGRDGATTSSWDVLGRWAARDRSIRRTSVSDRGDDLASVAVDTWRVDDEAGLASYQLQVRLMRRSGASTPSPSVDVVGAVASRLPSGTPPVSAPGAARGVVLDVPRYSQMAHRGHSPEYGGGGQAWCSPTSTAMVLGYYDALPAPRSYAWVGADHLDPWVDEVARRTYDAAYEGTGNWSFNTAYAASRAGHAFVTRLRSLREAETLIAAGIPVVASVSFPAGALTGAPISASSGHVLVIVGFTEGGDVVVNDPAASSRAGVRRTYDRAEFEAAWLPTSGGTVYVIRDDAHPLPAL